MIKKTFHIVCIFLIVFNFGFTSQDKSSEIKDVLKKMNEFYLQNAVSMIYQIEYIKSDDSIEKEGKTKFSLQGKDYSCENENEFILKNSSYYLVADKQERTIGIQKIESANPQVNMEVFTNSFDKLLKYYKSSDLSTDNNSYTVTLKEQDKKTIFTISKKDYHLMKFEYVFTDDTYYKSVIVNYINVESKKSFDKNHFSEKKLVKISKKKIKAVGAYQEFKVLNNLKN